MQMMSIHSSIFLYALLAPIGYLVLQHAAKQKEEPCVNRAGKIVAYGLMLVSLCGMLCGTWSHARAARRQHMMMEHMMMGMPGPMMGGMMGGMRGGMMGEASEDAEEKGEMHKNCPMADKAKAAKAAKPEAPAPKK